MNRPTITSDREASQHLAEIIYREAILDQIITVDFSDTSNNYYSCTVILDGIEWKSSDGEQEMKITSIDVREAIVMDAEDIETSIDDLVEVELRKVFNLKQ
jgi:hypothetical protein